MRHIFLAITIFIIHAAIYSQSKLDEIKTIIANNYAYEINVDSLVDIIELENPTDSAAIFKLFSYLDPHSTYLDEKRYSDFNSDMGGSFSGIGMDFKILNDTVVIGQVFEGGPALKAGLKTGDKLISVNGIDLTNTGYNFDKIVSSIRGPENSEANIRVMRNNKLPLIELKINRGKIRISSVNAVYMLTKNIGYIKFSSFTANTAEDVHNALVELKDAGMKKLILDLRDNTGGYFFHATAIADEFIAGEKLLVYTEGRPGTKKEYFSKEKGEFEKGKMIVLVNEETASSAEILTGALQDNHRAVIVGKRSYGKGLVQMVYTLKDEKSAVVLTTARYFTPSGRCIQRSYESGTDTYFKEFVAIISNNGELPDSLRNNRVIDWGIIPDHFIAEDTLPENELLRQLNYRQYIEKFALLIYSENPQDFSRYNSPDELNSQFIPGDAIFQKFKQYVAVSETKPSDYYGPLHYIPEEMDEARDKLENAIKAYIAKLLWGDNAYWKLLNQDDDEIEASMKLLK